MGRRICQLGSTADSAWIGLNWLCCLAGRSYAPFSRISKKVFLESLKHAHSPLQRSNFWDLKSCLIFSQATVKGQQKRGRNPRECYKNDKDLSKNLNRLCAARGRCIGFFYSMNIFCRKLNLQCWFGSDILSKWLEFGFNNLEASWKKFALFSACFMAIEAKLS